MRNILHSVERVDFLVEAKACLMMTMRLVNNNVVSYKSIRVHLEKDTVVICESQFIWFVPQGDLFSDAPKSEPMEKEKTIIQATGKI